MEGGHLCIGLSRTRELWFELRTYEAAFGVEPFPSFGLGEFAGPRIMCVYFNSELSLV